jgi:hypothetical protein
MPSRDSERIAVWSETCDPALYPILGVSQVVSSGRSLAIAIGHTGPLYIVALDTAETRQLAASVSRLLTDHSRERLAFQVPSLSSNGASALWAGAFPY